MKLRQSISHPVIKMNWYLGCWKKFAVFSGRARRQEFWMFALFNFLASIALAIVDGILGTNGGLGAIYSLAALIPGLAVSARRLHDTDHSGWWILINLIPMIGCIIYLVFLCSDSKPGENRFGPNPKGL